MGPKSDDQCSLEGPCEDTEGPLTRKPCADGGGHWSDVAASQEQRGRPQTAGAWGEA